MKENSIYKALKTNFTRRYRFPILVFLLMFVITICLSMFYPAFIIYFGLLSIIFAVSLLITLLFYYREAVNLKKLLKQVDSSPNNFKQINNLIITNESLIYWFRRTGYIIKYNEINSCSLLEATESPWNSGFAYQVMLLIGFNNINLSIKMVSKENAQRILTFIQCNSPKLPGYKEYDISLDSIVEE